MPLPKSARLLAATVAVALGALAIHFLAAFNADASPPLTKTLGFMLKC